MKRLLKYFFPSFEYALIGAAALWAIALCSLTILTDSSFIMFIIAIGFFVYLSWGCVKNILRDEDINWDEWNSDLDD